MAKQHDPKMQASLGNLLRDPRIFSVLKMQIRKLAKEDAVY